IYSKPVPVANKMAALLRAKGCDLVICLSHIGITEDTAMIPQTHNIDIVFGGHSHTFLRRPKFISDADGKKIPLIHTGCNGIYVGRLDLTLTH
ncbi:MAG: bifunctional metallophosphatase/5'-nucleotidase, partial [Bacteroidaceae bacterium]|nr:bifunctional metallophosphatase/5'-nucleotidase [Bacteroidaceae bacterium]